MGGGAKAVCNFGSAIWWPNLQLIQKRHLVVKFATNASHQILNLCKLRYLVAKVVTNGSGATWWQCNCVNLWPNLKLIEVGATWSKLVAKIASDSSGLKSLSNCSFLRLFQLWM